MMPDVSSAILSGTLVASGAYLFKQAADFFYFDRLSEYKAIRGRAIEGALFMSHFLATLPRNPKEEIISTWINENQSLRRTAGAMLSFQSKRHPLLWGVPPQCKIREATSALLGLSRCSRESDVEKAQELAKKLIKALDANTTEAQVNGTLSQDSETCPMPEEQNGSAKETREFEKTLPGFWIRTLTPGIFVLIGLYFAPGVFQSYQSELLKKRIPVYENLVSALYESVLEPHEVTYGWATHKKIYRECIMAYSFGSKNVSSHCDDVLIATHKIATTLSDKKCGDVKLAQCTALSETERAALLTQIRSSASAAIGSVTEEASKFVPMPFALVKGPTWKETVKPEINSGR